MPPSPLASRGPHRLRRAGAAVAALLMSLLSLGCGGAPSAEEVPSIEVERGLVEVRVTAAGPVQPHRAVEVKSRASGEVLELPFDAGAAVSEGTTLVVIDPREELEKVRLTEADRMTAEAKLLQARARRDLEIARVRLEIERARANLARARAELAQARVQEERDRHLYAKGLSSDQTRENTRTRLEVAEAAVEVAEADLALASNREHQLEVTRQDVVLAEAGLVRADVALERARERLADSRIRAAMDGVILEREVEVGQIIASGISNIGGGTTLLTLADVSRLSVKAMVDEADIGALREGEAAVVTADAFPERRFEGEVGWIAPLGTTESDVTAFEVLVEVLGEGKEFLRPGMTATCQFVTARAEGVLWIPPAALRRYRDEAYVNLVDASEARGYRPVAVEVGLRNQDRVEVRGEGIEAGVEVLVGRPESEESGSERGADPIWFLKKKKQRGAPRGPAPSS